MNIVSLFAHTALLLRIISHVALFSSSAAGPPPSKTAGGFKPPKIPDLSKIAAAAKSGAAAAAAKAAKAAKVAKPGGPGLFGAAASAAKAAGAAAAKAPGTFRLPPTPGPKAPGAKMPFKAPGFDPSKLDMAKIGEKAAKAKSGASKFKPGVPPKLPKFTPPAGKFKPPKFPTGGFPPKPGKLPGQGGPKLNATQIQDIQDRQKKQFALMDGDSDGKVTAEEVAKVRQALLERKNTAGNTDSFEAFEKSLLTKVEKDPNKWHSAQDKNKDGALAWEEYKYSPPSASGSANEL